MIAELGTRGRFEGGEQASWAKVSDAGGGRIPKIGGRKLPSGLLQFAGSELGCVSPRYGLAKISTAWLGLGLGRGCVQSVER